MKQTITKGEFIDSFRQMDRHEQLGGYEGLSLLFDYLEEIERGTGEELELDVIALCCDYACSNEDEIRDYYDIPEDEGVIEYLNDHTCVVGECDAGIIYQQF